MVPSRQPSPPLREISHLVILKMYSFRLQPPYGKRLENNEFAQKRYVILSRSVLHRSRA